MEKFLKSIFTTSEKRKSGPYEGEEERDFTPPLDGRRKLSMSRSGRMKQANKKRHSLSVDLYGEDIQPVERPKTIEYHVNKIQTQQTISKDHIGIKKDQKGAKKDLNKLMNDQVGPTIDQIRPQKDQTELRKEDTQIKTTEEEIESAFRIIDEVL